MDEQLEFMKVVVRRLNAAGIPYMLTGSMAMTFYATPRMTRDVDVVVELSPQDTKRFSKQFTEDCYVDGDSVDAAVSRRGMFNIINNRSIVKVDFIVRKADAYHETEFARRRYMVVDGFQVAVASPEDLILSKLLWAKDSGSAAQRGDVRHLIKAVVGLDWTYLEQWAGTLGVAEELRRARSE